MPRALLGAGRAVAVAVALVALLGLTTVPHHHESTTEERSCPACHVSRFDGGGVPEATVDAPEPPAGQDLLPPATSPDVTVQLAHAAPLPSRGPPPVSPAEPL
ncbi:MAG: hypothetical protein KJ062_13660 [Thermoanaerobaculia bacterium]|nr:hypothetical protein [Thermoanaerobaculia bacterium]